MEWGPKLYKLVNGDYNRFSPRIFRFTLFKGFITYIQLLPFGLFGILRRNRLFDTRPEKMDFQINSLPLLLLWI